LLTNKINHVQNNLFHLDQQLTNDKYL
jgi:hypothetical protein